VTIRLLKKVTVPLLCVQQAWDALEPPPRISGASLARVPLEIAFLSGTRMFKVR
jgi:hypothetical protein